MQATTIKQKILATISASSFLLIPMLVAAHGGVDDGHIEEVLPEVLPEARHLGESALLNPADPRWWYILAISAILTTALSYLVWKYLQVPQVKKPDAQKPEQKK